MQPMTIAIFSIDASSQFTALCRFGFPHSTLFLCASIALAQPACSFPKPACSVSGTCLHLYLWALMSASCIFQLDLHYLVVLIWKVSVGRTCVHAEHDVNRVYTDSNRGDVKFCPGNETHFEVFQRDGFQDLAVMNRQRALEQRSGENNYHVVLSSAQFARPVT